MSNRDDVVRVARSYIDTPWHASARLPGVGMDCAGIIICIMRELGICSADWDVEPYLQIPDGKSMIAQLDKYLTRIDRNVMQPGDVACIVTDKHPQHLGIVGDHVHGGLSLIHAASAATPPRVIEHRLMLARNCRLTGAYALPGVT